MAFKDSEIIESYLEELIEKQDMIERWTRQDGYPHSYYDYSTDDQNDFEYQQDMGS